jgi:1-aminocyclopropane-1-carboxylate deaminase/D-cysteine desulfhydrase-like pyridoxal-dependent ACC family enzyme
LTAEDILLVDGAGPAYGQAFDKNKEAIYVALCRGGIVLDPVFTSKAFAALPDLVAGGLISPSDSVVFLRTGGLPALFSPVYEAALLC